MLATAGLARADDGPRQPPPDAEQAFTEHIAAERAGRNLGSLAVAPDLVDVARRHAQAMADRGAVYHNPRLGDDVRGWEVVGENVGAGHDVDQLHAAFMASAVHRDEILFGPYREVGVGVAYGGDGRLYVTEVFRQSSSVAAAGATSGQPAPPPASPAPPAVGSATAQEAPARQAAGPSPGTTAAAPADPAATGATAPAAAAPVPAPIPAAPPGGPVDLPAGPEAALVSPADVAQEIPPAAAVAAALLLAVVAAQGAAVRRLGLA